MIDLGTVLSTSATVTVQAHWDRIENTANNLQWATEEKFNRSKAQWHEPVDMAWEQWLELFNPGPAHPLKHYSTTDFQVFLSPSTANVGDVWDLEPEAILPFLRQFHPGATMNLRHGQNGAKACLRAISPEYAEITFRIHARFILDTSIGAYLRPAQFTGHLVINRKSGTICQWTLSLPPRNSNVDIGAFRTADIGFVPRMELCSLSETHPESIAWETAITAEEAERKFQDAFYKFAEIEWTPIEDAVERAKASNRPIHAVLLFGALDDESC
ncbi:MAG: hypothetical protein OXU27_05310 [Candidatus Poribacteria bacterium]|nr:hypothetical protein [Candidatus Poribacteria bacterium]